MSERILIGSLDSAILSSLSRYFQYTQEKKYKITTFKNKENANIYCYILLLKKENELFDEICNIRSHEYNQAKALNSDIVFKPIFILKYLNDEFVLKQPPFYNIISVKQLNKIYTIFNLPRKNFIKKDYQARRNIKFVCRGYIRKIIHDINGCSTLEQKKAKFEKLINQLNIDCLNMIKEECGL